MMYWWYKLSKTDCGFGAHRKCSESVPNDCCPDLRHIRRIFGIDLTTFCKASQLPRPFIVELCVAEIERRGLRVEGLYRACGSSDEIDLWKNRFETDWEHTPLAQIEDIHVVTGLLKQYLRLLPIPLITFDSYQRFVDSASMWIEHVRMLVAMCWWWFVLCRKMLPRASRTRIAGCVSSFAASPLSNAQIPDCPLKQASIADYWLLIAINRHHMQGLCIRGLQPDVGEKPGFNIRSDVDIHAQHSDDVSDDELLLGIRIQGHRIDDSVSW